MCARDWAGSKPSPMMRPQSGMRGRKVGVYGMGEIGRKIAARVAAFESEVGYFSRSKRDVPYRYFDSLEGLADWCSVLIVAVRAGPDTAPRRQRRHPQAARRGRPCRQHRARLGDRPARADCSADRQDHRRRRLRRFRKRAARPRCTDRAPQRRPHPAYRRPHAGIACGDAGLRDGKSGRVFCRQAAAISGQEGGS